MKFSLSRAYIVISQNCEDVRHLREDQFQELCRYLEGFPALAHPAEQIQGLYLGGDYYFRRIPFSMAAEIPLTEIESIRTIRPVMEYNALPFELRERTFSLFLDAATPTMTDLESCLTHMDTYLNNFPSRRNGREIEVHLAAGRDWKTFSDTITVVVGNFEGRFSVELNLPPDMEHSRSDSIMLPIGDPATDPTEIGEFLRIYHKNRIIRIRTSFKIFEDRKKLILEMVNKLKAGLSLYSDESSWLLDHLRLLVDKKLIEEPSRSVLAPFRGFELTLCPTPSL